MTEARFVGGAVPRTSAPRRLLRAPDRTTVVEVALAAVVAVVVLAALTLPGDRLAGPLAIAVPAGLVVLAGVVLNPRVDVSIGVVLLYLGLLDGYLKLRSGGDSVTALRDVLIFAVVSGVLIRQTLQETPMHMPRYGLHVLLVVAIVIAQGFNPDTSGVRGAFGGYRQHLEFVPLFFLGYMTFRSERKLRWVLVGLLVVVAINAVVAVIQYTLTPLQFASWGPGYAERVLGQGGFTGAPRIFTGGDGVVRVRPFGLGSDLGASGVLGYLGLPAALALLLLTKSNRARGLSVLALAVCVVGIVAAQSRSNVLLAIVAVVFFLLVTVTPRTAMRTTAGVIGGGIAIVLALAIFANGKDSSSFDRLRTITPSQVQGTIDEDRGGSIRLVGSYSLEYPLGNGLGRVGPAGGFGGGPASGVNAETQFNFQIVETGTIGMLALLTLWLRVLYDGVRLVRRLDEDEARYVYAALVSAVAAMSIAWFVGPVTVTTPTAPLFWLVLGCIAWAVEQQRAVPATEDIAGDSAFGMSRLGLPSG